MLSTPLDVAIDDLETAGIPAPSVVRMKMFTMDNRLILENLGHLSNKDAARVKKSLKKLSH